MVDSPDLITEPALQALASRALGALGMNPDDAAYAASILVLADLFGISTHGVSRIVSYGERLRVGGIDPTPPIRVEKVAPALIRVDGANGVGTLVGRRALDAAMAAARETGIAMAFVRGSNHFGPIAPYCHIAAQAGFATMIASNATTTITPWGGKDARLGNNPIGFGMPRPGGDPIILDMAISVAARAKIRRASERGEAIPQGWATDADGRPTTDAVQALKGFLLPIGGHKGYGLALMVDLFAGMLSGASFLTHVSSWQDDPDKPQNLGHFFILIDVSRLATDAERRTRIDDFAGILHSTPAAAVAEPVRLPGEFEYARLHSQRRDGISIPATLLEQLRGIADGEDLERRDQG